MHVEAGGTLDVEARPGLPFVSRKKRSSCSFFVEICRELIGVASCIVPCRLLWTHPNITARCFEVVSKSESAVHATNIALARWLLSSFARFSKRATKSERH